MDEADEGFSVFENALATPVPSTDVIREVMNDAVQGTGVIENIDDALSAEAVTEIINLTDNDITMTENLVATPEQSTEGISELENQVAEFKMEKKDAIFMLRTEGIDEIMDQESEVNNVIENLIATAR